MSVKKYCYCENNCKYETLDKEEILTAIAQAVATGKIGDCDTGFITTLKTINGLPLRFFIGEQSEYAALSADDKKNLFALITNDTTKEGLLKSISEMQTDLKELTDGLRSGKFEPKNAANALKLEGGEIIRSGDLNSYYRVGNYFVGSVADAPNVSNMPIKTAGVLKVISGNGDAYREDWFCIIQIFIAHSTGDIYIRAMIHNNTGNNWQPWERVGWLGKTLDKGINPNEASLVFRNTNGFGTSESAEKGLWRVWNYGNDTYGYYCYLVPSIDNKQCIGLPSNRVKDAFIENVHGTADKAIKADKADEALTAGYIKAQKSNMSLNGTDGQILVLQSNSVYVFKVGSDLLAKTYTLYVGDNNTSNNTFDSTLGLPSTTDTVGTFLRYENNKIYQYEIPIGALGTGADARCVNSYSTFEFTLIAKNT
jgi:hypothetical protein